MYLEDILPKMSKLYLGRIVDSFLKEVRIETEDEMRDVILRNIEEFQNKERVIKNLNFNDETRDIALLNEMILMSLMEQEGYILTEKDLFTMVEQMETDILEQSRDENFMERAIPPETRRIFSAVLTEAWKKGDSLNSHEINILNVLRKELNLTKRDQYLMECQIGRFPQKHNQLHTSQQISKSLINLSQEDLYCVSEKIHRITLFLLKSNGHCDMRWVLN